MKPSSSPPAVSSTVSPPRRRTPATLHVFADGFLVFRGRRIACALGRGGISAAKREGDGATPCGRFPVRGLRFRPDRARPVGALPAAPILRRHGWCDDPSHRSYNRPVWLPVSASCENLRRDDGLYDLVVILGHNDRPPRPGDGSAIFVHIKPPDGATAGCVALGRADLCWLLTRLRPGDMVVIHLPGSVAPGLPIRQGLRRRKIFDDLD